MLNLNLENIQVLSKNYSILNIDMDIEKWGETDHIDQVIKINNKLSEESQEITLFHEIIHTIDIAMNLNLTENQIIVLSEVLTDTLKRNEELVIS